MAFHLALRALAERTGQTSERLGERQSPGLLGDAVGGHYAHGHKECRRRFVAAPER